MAHIIDDPESGISYLLCSKLKNTPDEDTISLDLTESIEGPRTYFTVALKYIQKMPKAYHTRPNKTRNLLKVAISQCWAKIGSLPLI